MENEKRNDTPKHKSRPRVEKITKRDLRFVELLLGGMPAASAARECGFKPSGALKASEWIRQTREQSSKPELYDIWRRRNDEQLRILGVTAENVKRELAIIGFSSIDKFIDFPSKADAIADHDADSAVHDVIAGKVKIGPEGISEDDENDSKSWKKYRPGGVIKLKSIEDIPAELMPAIQEIHETKDGIRIKLHPKLPALNLLAQMLNMIRPDSGKDDQPVDYQINISVNGSRSKMLLPPEGEK